MSMSMFRPRPTALRRLTRGLATLPRAEIRADKVHVTLDGRATAFDTVFLRDHCRCPTCVHPGTKQRLQPLPTGTPDGSVSSTAESLAVKWEDGHESAYPWTFLAAAAYDPPVQSRARTASRRTTWGADVKAPSTTHEAIMRGEVLDLLDKVHEYGFAFVHNVPATPEATEETIKRIGPIRHTHYGGFWDFTADMSHGDLAYSNEPLPAHTDTTYFSDPAGLQIFHLLSHPPPGTGGHTLLVDGLHVAALLRARDPEAYAVLSRLPVPAHASGTRGTMLRPQISRAVLQHDETGRLAQVRWNNEDRGVLGQEGWGEGDVMRWYDAARQLEGLIKSEQAEFWVPLRPGTMLVIDNWRVMHGRSAFTGKRRMCGAYVGADDWHSRRTWLGGEKGLWETGW